MKQHLLTLTFCALSPIAAVVAGPVTAAEMNGTWKTKGGNEFKVWKIGKEMLRIEFFGVFRYDSATGPTANTGEGQGVASLEGDTAKFKPDGTEDDCAITLKFSRDKLVVTQTGTCGFGFNVTAEGTYKKVSSREPKFDSGEGD
jgi:hypothetical protein